jgi:ADP-dependent NAD(P)H-hydrate dehydratase / NAD(P)H-hydrate epimerase
MAPRSITPAGVAVEILSVEEMYSCDAATIKGGTKGAVLMENAGRATAEAIERRFAPGTVAVLCGPGNNGGDGFVIARHLAKLGWTVRLGLVGKPGKLKGDAALMAKRWKRKPVPVTPEILDGANLVVDALFGVGLGRALDGPVRETVEAIESLGLPCVGVDIPSGVDGQTGEVLGAAPRCALTVTFCRRKPGHLLLPGRTYCGEVEVADIGITSETVAAQRPDTVENRPNCWLDDYPWPRITGHKYSRGHAVVVGGPVATSGAARMAARAALRIGAGLVTVACPGDALPVYAAQQTAVMNQLVDSAEQLAEMLDDPRKNATLIGPGCGLGDQTWAMTLELLAVERPCVLDADSLTVFKSEPDQLFRAINSPCVLTPHEGEFARLFDPAGGRLERTRRAAVQAGAVVLLKGGDTVIAAPDGRAAINTNAPAELATAGAGDVLAGLVLGLLAQGMPAFEAACAAAWIHGEAASLIGPGLIAEDLTESLPRVLFGLREAARHGVNAPAEWDDHGHGHGHHHH